MHTKCYDNKSFYTRKVFFYFPKAFALVHVYTFGISQGRGPVKQSCKHRSKAIVSTNIMLIILLKKNAKQMEFVVSAFKNLQSIGNLIWKVNFSSFIVKFTKRTSFKTGHGQITDIINKVNIGAVLSRWQTLKVITYNYIEKIRIWQICNTS